MDLYRFFVVLSIAAIPVLLAITLHEVAHGRMALRFGDRTAEQAGRLSLNPLRHIDPIGTVLVPALLLALGGFLFGWAKPVPVNAGRLRRPRQDMVWVAAAGPGSNLLMALGWALVLSAVLKSGGGTAAEWLGSMASVGIYINLLLAVFNMLPIPPLDGGRVLSNLLPPSGLSRALDKVEPFGLFIVLGLVVTGILFKLLAGPIDWLQGMLLGLVGVRGY
ncbi:MAG: site-2 protease family protein [Steroidobacteraceae bacterium]